MRKFFLPYLACISADYILCKIECHPVIIEFPDLNHLKKRAVLNHFFIPSLQLFSTPRFIFFA